MEAEEFHKCHHATSKQVPLESSLFYFPSLIGSWSAFEFAIQAMRPLARATDAIHSVSTTLAFGLSLVEGLVSFQCTFTLGTSVSLGFPNHFENLRCHDEFKEFAEKALAKCNSRWVKNFQTPAAEVNAFLDPQVINC